MLKKVRTYSDEFKAEAVKQTITAMFQRLQSS